jgi:general secretion pathway protein K
MTHQRGMVLIAVLGMVDLLSVLLSLLLVESHTQQTRLQAQFAQTDARYMAYSTVALAEQVLESDTAAADGTTSAWADYRVSRTFAVDEGTISMRLDDALSLPNINRFTSDSGPAVTTYAQALQRYLQARGVDPSLADVARDWVDADSNTSGYGGAESGYYVSEDPPYRTPNTDMVTPDELNLMRGMTRQNRMAFVSATAIVPEGHIAVNINTLDPAWMRALLPEATTLTNALGKRISRPYLALGDFAADAGLSELTKAVELGVRSTYFTLQAETTAGTAQIRADVLLKRGEGGVTVRRFIWR